jgi:predicted ATPase
MAPTHAEWRHSTRLYLTDEPESALSFQGQLQLLRLLHDGAASRAQFVLATQLPILMCAEGAAIFELDGVGIHRVDDDDVIAVALWRRFLEEPETLLSALYADDD